MKAEIERISPVECRVRVEIPWEEVSGRLTTKLRELRGRAKIPGFRPGKVPPHLVERMFGRGVRQELARDLVQETFQTAVAQNDTVPLTQPVLESSSLEKEEPFRYEARFEVPPPIEPKDYEGVPVRRRSARIDEEKVEAELKRRQDALIELLPIEEAGAEAPTQAGDMWTVDVDGKLGDTELSRKEVRVEIGAKGGELVPGLGEALEGTNRSEVGTVKELTFTLPADRVRQEFKDQQAVLKVGLRDVRLKHVPERDDEFARDTGEAETLTELEEKIRQSVLEADKGEAERDARRSLVATLLERNPVDAAPSMIAREVQAQVDATKQQLAAQGLDLSKVGSNEAELAQRIRPQALFNVRAFLLLDAIGKAENLDVSDEELDAEVEEIAQERGQNLARLRATMEKDGQLLMLRAQLREEKILDFLMDKAKVTEGEVEPAEVAEEGVGEPKAGAAQTEGAADKPKTKKKASKKKAAKKTAKKTAKKASKEAGEAEEPAGAAAEPASGKKTAKKKSGQSRRRRRKTAES